MPAVHWPSCKKDYDSARRYLSEAKTLGSEQAGITLEQLEKGRH